MGSPRTAPPGPGHSSAWTMLLAFTLGFAMSQAFRTVAAIAAPPLQRELGLSPQQLGVFAGAFHFAFGTLQPVMGIGLDWWGPRRTVLAVAPLAVAGALLAAWAPGYGVLVAAQALIGIGCAPAFVACTLFIARHFAPERFAAVSGMTMGLGGVGMLLTGTPLAWLIDGYSWRAGFVALAAGAALGWLAVLLFVREPARPPRAGADAGLLQALRAGLRGYGELLRLPHTWGIVILGGITYASFLALRGLWLGPLLVERHRFSLVASGNVALAVSALGMLSPAVFGRLDPGERTRRRWIVGGTLLFAALFAAMALGHSAWLEVVLSLAISMASGYIVLQYADVRSAYPAHLTGRAMAVFTMAMFMGVALVQSFTGWAAASASALGWDRYAGVFGGLALVLLIGAYAFMKAPQPER